MGQFEAASMKKKVVDDERVHEEWGRSVGRNEEDEEEDEEEEEEVVEENVDLSGYLRLF